MASHVAVSFCAAVEQRRGSTSDFSQSCHQVMSRFNLFSPINTPPPPKKMLITCSIAVTQYCHKLHTCGVLQKDNIVYAKETQEEAGTNRHNIMRNYPVH